MAACVAILSLMRTLELEFLQPHPRPILQKMELIIPSNKQLIQSIHQNLGFLMELFDKNRMDGVEAIKELVTKLGDMAFRLEGEIEFQIAHLYETAEGEDTCYKLGLILQQAMKDIDAVKEGLIQSLHQKLGFLISVLDENRMDGVEALKDLETKLRLGDAEKSSSPPKLGRILQQAIVAIEEALVKIKNEYKLQETKKTVLDDVPRYSSQPPASDSDNKMVGKDEEFKIIKKMLIQHSSTNREVVLIKGMGGIGKTTLARQIYRDQEIASHFDMRAWGVASQHHNKRQMLLALLNSMGFAESSNDDLETKLYQRLKGQRYLVVIDDVWSNGAWNDVQRCFPDDGCGSRVLITTRLEEVANSTCSNKDDFYHKMSFLNQSESWELFCKKAYKAGEYFYFPFYLSETTTLNLKVFKLLRVLHFTSGSMFREIADLVHLRYLPPAVGQYKISKFSRAWNLQTLYIRVDDKRSYLEFPQLQYFSCFSICGHPPKFVHQNLQSICWMKPNHCTKEFFRNVPNLKKVRISGDRSKCNDCIENLAHLEQLERLNINAYEEEHYMSVDMIPINNSIALLSNLEKLTLRNTNFEWKGINILSSLPKLKVLKLFFFACVGEEWELEDEVFSQLIYLEINSIDLKQWKAGSHNFPELERLLLYRCKRLEEIQPDFGEIPNLKLIELKGCLTSVVDSAKQIETDQRDSGNDDMIVIEENAIQPNDELEADEDDFDEL